MEKVKYIHENGEKRVLPKYIFIGARFLNVQTKKKFTIKGIRPLENRLNLQTYVNNRIVNCDYLISSFCRDFQRDIFIKVIDPNRIIIK